VGVYQRKLGGLAELAAETNVEVVTDDVKALDPENGKWSAPRGQPFSQYACQDKPAEDRLLTNCGLPLTELNE
jgi:hypothetical protein